MTAQSEHVGDQQRREEQKENANPNGSRKLQRPGNGLQSPGIQEPSHRITEPEPECDHAKGAARQLESQPRHGTQAPEDVKVHEGPNGQDHGEKSSHPATAHMAKLIDYPVRSEG